MAMAPLAWQWHSWHSYGIIGVAVAPLTQPWHQWYGRGVTGTAVALLTWPQCHRQSCGAVGMAMTLAQPLRSQHQIRTSCPECGPKCRGTWGRDRGTRELWRNHPPLPAPLRAEGDTGRGGHSPPCPPRAPEHSAPQGGLWSGCWWSGHHGGCWSWAPTSATARCCWRRGCRRAPGSTPWRWNRSTAPWPRR